jgi:hypothetical protein
MVSDQRVVHACPVGYVACGRALESAFRKSLDSCIQQFLLRHDAALLLFSRRLLIACYCSV